MEGWRLKPEWLLSLGEGVREDGAALQRAALDADLAETSEPALPEGGVGGLKAGALADATVVQVVKLRNLSAPSDAPHSTSAPRILRVYATDGTAKCSLVELG